MTAVVLWHLQGRSRFEQQLTSRSDEACVLGEEWSQIKEEYGSQCPLRCDRCHKAPATRRFRLMETHSPLIAIECWGRSLALSSECVRPSRSTPLRLRNIIALFYWLLTLEDEGTRT